MDKNGIKLKNELLLLAQETSFDDRLVIITRFIEAFPDEAENIIRSIRLNIIKDHVVDNMRISALAMRHIFKALYMGKVPGRMMAIKIIKKFIQVKYGLTVVPAVAGIYIAQIQDQFNHMQDEIVKELSNNPTPDLDLDDVVEQSREPLSLDSFPEPDNVPGDGGSLPPSNPIPTADLVFLEQFGKGAAVGETVSLPSLNNYTWNGSLWMPTDSYLNGGSDDPDENDMDYFNNLSNN